MFLENWADAAYEDPHPGHGPLGWASTEEEAQAVIRQLCHRYPALAKAGLVIEPVEDYGLFDNYWWPLEWPSSEAYAIVMED